MNLKRWFNQASKELSLSELSFICKHLLKEYLPELVISKSELPSYRVEMLDKVVQLYQKGIPLSYIVGKEEFFGLELYVNREVFIPRPETEILVEKALSIIQMSQCRFVLDLGCGSANIALAIAQNISFPLKILASDISFFALKTARKNIDSYNQNIWLIRGDLFAPFRENSFDLIISNPPYVARKDIKGNLLWEPLISLEAGKLGLDFIIRIIQEAHRYLKKDGYLLFEFGYNQKERILKLILREKRYKIEEWIKDYSGWWRGCLLKKL